MKKRKSSNPKPKRKWKEYWDNPDSSSDKCAQKTINNKGYARKMEDSYI